MILDSKEDLFYIKGCYIRSSDYPEYIDKIFILSDNDGSNEYKDSISFFKSYSDFLFSYKVGIDTMSVFNTPYIFEKDYELFIQGKYSKFSKKLKGRLADFHKITKAHKLYSILSKDSVYKKQLEWKLSHSDDGRPLSEVKIPDDNDLMDIPDLLEETFINVDKIKIDDII